MKKSYILLALSSFLTINSYGDSLVYKFQDSKGNIIYSDSMPSSEKGMYSVMSGASGVLKKVVEKELSKEEIAKKENEQKEVAKKVEITEQQKKKDNSLLATYSNVDEIDKMKKFELNQIGQNINNQINAITEIKDKINQLDNGLRQNPTNKLIQSNLDEMNKQLEQQQNNLESNKKLLEDRTKKYDNDKRRYVELLNEMATEKEKMDNKKQ